MSGSGNAVCRCGKVLDEPADLPRSERRPCPACGSLARQVSEEVVLSASGAVHADAATVAATATADLPALTLKALLDFGGKTDDGQLVRAVATPWFEIIRMMLRDPAAMYQIDPRKWEEIIAGAYERAGFDEVILTPRSGDGGKDVIATRWGVGSIRIYDEVKAKKPDRVVKATEVRALLHVIVTAQGVGRQGARIGWPARERAMA